MFKRLISLDDAKARIAEAFSPATVGVEEVALAEAMGRVLADDVVSPVDVPPFSRSTVDGYAVRAEDTAGVEENRPVALRLAGSVAVGELSDLTVKKREAVEIVTGAPLPVGAGAAVMVEDTSEEKGRLLVYKAVVRGENVMEQGSDLRAGEAVLKRGTTLSPRELGVLAALGFTVAHVLTRPKVAVISTGAELVEPGKPLPPGKIFDINYVTLTAAILESGGQPIGFGIVHDDDVKLLRKVLRRAVEQTDMVITSGGVSVGPKDVIPRVLGELGKPGLIVHGVAVKPGKPVAFAVVDGVPVFSLPGHPTSSLLMFHLLVRPTLLKMAGRGTMQRPSVKATIAQKLFPARGRRTFISVTLSQDKGGKWRASQVPSGESGAITTLANADGYVEIGETQQFVEAGSEVTVFLF